MKTACGLICVSFCLFVGSPRSKAASIICTALPLNIVSNCGFETGSFASWALSGNDVPFQLNNLYGVEGLDPVDGISPDGGSHQAYFSDLVSNATTLSQSLNTIAGRPYVVSWYLAQDTATGGRYNNAFSASFGGVSLVSLTEVPVEGYTYYSYTGIATSSTTVLSFTLGNDLGSFLLDDISVLTPEPAAWALVLAAASLCIIGRKSLTRRLAA